MNISAELEAYNAKNDVRTLLAFVEECREALERVRKWAGSPEMVEHITHHAAVAAVSLLEEFDDYADDDDDDEPEFWEAVS